MVDGYKRVKYRENINHRTLCYVIAKPHLKDQNLTVYDFMPMDGDPTPEEIIKIQQENLEREFIAARKMKDDLIKAFNDKINGRV